MRTPRWRARLGGGEHVRPSTLCIAALRSDGATFARLRHDQLTRDFVESARALQAQSACFGFEDGLVTKRRLDALPIDEGGPIFVFASPECSPAAHRGAAYLFPFIHDKFSVAI